MRETIWARYVVDVCRMNSIASKFRIAPHRHAPEGRSWTLGQEALLHRMPAPFEWIEAEELVYQRK